MVRILMQSFITHPLHALYFDGPTTLGFWGGAKREDICFSLTGTASSFWSTHPEQCAELVTQKFNAFSVVVLVLLYIFFLYRLVNILTFHVCCTQPVLREIRRLGSATPKTVPALES
jgi:hypothetical protein